jgi:tRNA nucleotidyltransferase (CCA-adding enzyme)
MGDSNPTRFDNVGSNAADNPGGPEPRPDRGAASDQTISNWLERIPPEVLLACRRLADHGYAAYVVGGAVRDLLRSPEARAKDFDLTTSARPEQVIAVFGQRRTIPTGIEHGTVTVMCEPLTRSAATTPEGPAEKPAQRPTARPVEITTFRGETGFSDGRRPDRVEFITDLVEDLRRRDFTINAIAYDPVGGRLIDPFGGQKDLQRRVLRAVGDPVARFAEDGLRVMRAVRFAAQLEFSVESSTRAAFAGALPTLRRVSRERVRDELLKILASPRPSRGLRLLIERSDEEPGAGWGEHGRALGVVLPEIDAMLPTDAPAAAVAWWLLVDLVAPPTRLAAALWPLRRWLAGPGAVLRQVSGGLPKGLIELLDERLKLPARQRQHLGALLLEPLPLAAGGEDPQRSDVALRRLLARYPFELLEDLLQLVGFEAIIAGQPGRGDEQFQLLDRLQRERARKPPLSIGELALSGKVLMGELGVRPGPQLGEILAQLLQVVLVDPERNERGELLRLASDLLRVPPKSQDKPR